MREFVKGLISHFAHGKILCFASTDEPLTGNMYKALYSYKQQQTTNSVSFFWVAKLEIHNKLYQKP